MRTDTEVTAIYCGSCDTKIEGHFSLCRFCRLTAEQKAFIETFIKCGAISRRWRKTAFILHTYGKKHILRCCKCTGHGMQSYGKPGKRQKDGNTLIDVGQRLITVEEAIELLKKYIPI